MRTLHNSFQPQNLVFSAKKSFLSSSSSPEAGLIKQRIFKLKNFKICIRKHLCNALKMRKSLFYLTVLLLALSSCNNKDKPHLIDDSKHTKYLFVLSADSGKIDGERLTLNGVKSVIYFSDRPQRIAGQMTLKKFVNVWSESNGGMKKDPPNAISDVIESGDSISFSLELSPPTIQDSQIKFTIKGTDEPEFGDFGPASLFIDAFNKINPQVVD